MRLPEGIPSRTTRLAVPPDTGRIDDEDDEEDDDAMTRTEMMM